MRRDSILPNDILGVIKQYTLTDCRWPRTHPRPSTPGVGLRGGSPQQQAGHLVARLDSGDVLRHDGEGVGQRHGGEDAGTLRPRERRVVLAILLREDGAAHVFQRN